MYFDDVGDFWCGYSCSSTLCAFVIVLYWLCIVDYGSNMFVVTCVI